MMKIVEGNVAGGRRLILHDIFASRRDLREGRVVQNLNDSVSKLANHPGFAHTFQGCGRAEDGPYDPLRLACLWILCPFPHLLRAERQGQHRHGQVGTTFHTPVARL